MKSLEKFARVLKLVLIYFVVMIVFVSCGDDDKEDNFWNTKGNFTWDNTVDVYTVGYQVENGQNNLVLWKNEQQQILENNVANFNTSGVYSVFVYNNDVYAVGSFNSVAVLWKNGVRHELSEINNTAAHSVFVYNNDVYVVGSTVCSGPAFLWKNDEEQILDAPGTADAYSVFIYNDDVYIGGYVMINSIPCPAYWKNGVLTVLNNSVTNYVNSIFVANNNIYAAGGHMDRGVIWNNKTEYISTNSPLESIFVDKGNIYACGKLELFKNKTKYKLYESGSSYGIYVSNNNVYVCGRESYRAVLWKNGPMKYIGNDNSMAFGIFVKSK